MAHLPPRAQREAVILFTGTIAGGLEVAPPRVPNGAAVDRHGARRSDSQHRLARCLHVRVP